MNALDNLRTLLAEHEERQRQLSIKTKQVDSLTTSQTKLRGELDQVKGQRTQLHHEVDGLRQERDKLRSEVDRLLDLNRSLKESLKEMAREKEQPVCTSPEAEFVDKPKRRRKASS